MTASVINCVDSIKMWVRYIPLNVMDRIDFGELVGDGLGTKIFVCMQECLGF